MTRVDIRLDALKLLKDWSTSLIVVQSGAIGVIGTFIRTVPEGWLRFLLAAIFACLILSIYFGAVSVAGKIPYIAQNVSDAEDWDMYAQTGGLGGASLGQHCLWQARLFMLSLVLFAIFAVGRSTPENTTTTVAIASPVQVQIVGNPNQ